MPDADPIAAWVAKVNRKATEIDRWAASMHPSAWPEALAKDFAEYRRLCASGPKEPIENEKDQQLSLF